MSSRTSEASKAIRLAWQNEQQLVQNGKGTRDWTPEQQRDILESGKAHDESGKAFEGHHMKNVANYPEHQGNPENIQFLSSEEHLAAHGGCFQNSTNGYFDPLTGETLDFGQGIKPCETISLSSPIAKRVNEGQGFDAESPADPTKEADRSDQTASRTTEGRAAGTSGNVKSKQAASKHQPGIKRTTIKSRLAGFGAGAKQLASNAVGFVVDNKDTISLLAKEVVLPAVATVAFGYITKSASNGAGGSHTATKTPGSSNLSDMMNSSIVSDVVKAGRASPCEHSVSGHVRNLNGMQISVRPYTRGGKS